MLSIIKVNLHIFYLRFEIFLSFAHKSFFEAKIEVLLTINSETRLPLLWTRRKQIKYAGVAAFVPEAHPADGDGWGVLRGGRGKLHVLLSTDTVLVARLVAQQGLILDVQPAHLLDRFTSVPGDGAGQGERLVRWSFQNRWRCYSAWNSQQGFLASQEAGAVWLHLCFRFVGPAHTHSVGVPPKGGGDTPAELFYKRWGSSSSSLLNKRTESS